MVIDTFCRRYAYSVGFHLDILTFVLDLYFLRVDIDRQRDKDDFRHVNHRHGTVYESSPSSSIHIFFESNQIRKEKKLKTKEIDFILNGRTRESQFN